MAAQTSRSSLSIVLARRHRRRLRQVDQEIPLLLDALSSAALAGLPPQSALRRAATVVDGPLAEELRTAVHAFDLGARWREQLDLLVARCPLRDLSRAVGVMSRTDAVGVSFADGMTTLAVRAREARRADLTQRARTAPVKMLFPLRTPMTCALVLAANGIANQPGSRTGPESDGERFSGARLSRAGC